MIIKDNCKAKRPARLYTTADLVRRVFPTPHAQEIVRPAPLYTPGGASQPLVRSVFFTLPAKEKVMPAPLYPPADLWYGVCFPPLLHKK